MGEERENVVQVDATAGDGNGQKSDNNENNADSHGLSILVVRVY